jgi:hypothetical protein
MRLLVITKPMIFGFFLATGISLTQPYLALGAGRSFGRPRGVKVSKIGPQQSFLRSFQGFDSLGRRDFLSHPFPGFGFGGVGEVSEQPVIIIQQFQSAPAPELREPAENRIYVPPRWVDGGYGVEVLQPGYWTVPKSAP